MANARKSANPTVLLGFSGWLVASQTLMWSLGSMEFFYHHFSGRLVESLGGTGLQEKALYDHETGF